MIVESFNLYIRSIQLTNEKKNYCNSDENHE